MENEQKAKAYDEALERARKQRDDYQKELDKTDKNSQLANILKAGISVLEMIFPQLKDSDDERIRKDIIDHFESIKSRALYDNQEESDNIISSCNEKIAYLEKQKEQKSVSAEELLVKAGLKHYKDGNMWCIFVGDNIQEGICGFGNTIDEALYQFLMEVLEIQKKPKVDIDKLRRDLYQSGYNDGYQHGKEDAQKEQKSVEWSKKDEKIIKTILGVLERDGQVTIYEQRGGTMSGSVGYSNKYEEEIAWLKDISLNHKKFIEAVDKLWSNEWSEEDEAHRDFILESLEDQIRFCKKDAEGAHYAKQIRTAQNWLKSFKSHWKPTKEHIDAIEECLEFYAESTDTYRHLKSLLSELMKL